MMQVSSPEAYDLLHKGALALAQVEQNGIKIDVDRLKQTRHDVQTTCKEKELWMRKHPYWEKWRKTYGLKSNLGSSDQLSHLLFRVLGYESQGQTKSGKESTNRTSLDSIDDPFVRCYTEWSELKKADGTFLSGIEKEVVKGVLRTIFNLHTAKTYRSSSDSPNFQNFPVRNDTISKLVRSCFIPRPGNRLIEIDYGGIEVKIAACYHRDPTMLEYIHDSSKDMHRDMAAEIYMCLPEQVNKMLRYVAKNRYVFPEFYGSYWEQVGVDLWNAIDLFDLKIEKGDKEIGVKKWLDKKGITQLGGGRVPPPGTFLGHIKSVESNFWGKRFPVYDKWKKNWYNEYLVNGGYRTLTGFYIKGLYSRNDVINHPVQGSAFHCLLWSLIELQKELKQRRMKSKIVGQIHDSILGDVPEHECDKYLKIAEDVMVHRIKEKWNWIITRLEVESEWTEVDGNWYEKKKVQVA